MNPRLGKNGDQGTQDLVRDEAPVAAAQRKVGRRLTSLPVHHVQDRIVLDLLVDDGRQVR